MPENDAEKKNQNNNNNKNNSKSKTPQRMGVFDKTNIRERNPMSLNNITSPIKPVTFLRKVFTDMKKENKVQSEK